MKESSSYKVHYDLRPAKQVERRMLLETFRRLTQGGFAIDNYQYTGFGALQFVDIKLFSRFLGIRRLWSVEHAESLWSRVDYNKPSSLVEIRKETANATITALDWDLQHILWLDYDDTLSADMLQDLGDAGRSLSPGSVILITVEVETPEIRELGLDKVPGPSHWEAYYREQAKYYLPPSLSTSDFGATDLPARNIEILVNVLRESMSRRPSVSFQPLFNFLYKDSHLMLTMGGMICRDLELAKLASSNLESLSFIRRSWIEKPYIIRVPVITRKERLYLDRVMPCDDGYRVRVFKLGKEELEQYREIYPYFPSFSELMLD